MNTQTFTVVSASLWRFQAEIHMSWVSEWIPFTKAHAKYDFTNQVPFDRHSQFVWMRKPYADKPQFWLWQVSDRLISELRNVSHSVCYSYRNDNVAYLYGMSKSFRQYEYKRDRCNINSQPASFALSMPENQIGKRGKYKSRRHKRNTTSTCRANVYRTYLKRCEVRKG